jgi:hypothetical protein
MEIKDLDRIYMLAVKIAPRIESDNRKLKDIILENLR